MTDTLIQLRSVGLSEVLRFLLLPGFTITEGYTQQPHFSNVQQLQDSSTLESQALSSSYHPQNLLHVTSSEVVSPPVPVPTSPWRGPYLHALCLSRLVLPFAVFLHP